MEKFKKNSKIFNFFLFRVVIVTLRHCHHVHHTFKHLSSQKRTSLLRSVNYFFFQFFNCSDQRLVSCKTINMYKVCWYMWIE